MAFKLITKPAAASPAAAYWGDLARGPQGTSRVAFGPAPRNKGLRAANNSATPIAKYEHSLSCLEIVWFNKQLCPLVPCKVCGVNPRSMTSCLCMVVVVDCGDSVVVWSLFSRETRDCVDSQLGICRLVCLSPLEPDHPCFRFMTSCLCVVVVW
jgi:hypothetical protein